ncbi:MAG: Txe/YoeB family addiction module toxin [Alphaproteobacteria bacterium]|nr:Txe/YoeB family addiction module toxin [Alphaproteobacteria bacterium]
MNVCFHPKAWQQYVEWQVYDKQVLKKINHLLKDIQRSPFEGIGKPEPLAYEFSGFWSRRITDEHRLVYTIDDGNIIIVQCRYHYDG